MKRIYLSLGAIFMACCLNAQTTFQVKVANPSKMERSDEPVVLNIAKYSEVNRAVVTRYHPSWMIPTVIVPTMNSVSSQILARRKQKSIPFSCLPKANKRLIPLAPLPNSLCLARTRSWQRISRTSTCEASPLTRKPRTVFTSFIPMVYVSRATWWRCESISTIDRPSTFMEKSTRDW